MKKHKYYIFDCDDNLLHLDTVTTVTHKHTGETVRWTSEDYARVKENNEFELYEPLDGDWFKSYKEFGDLYNPEGVNRFRRDVLAALRNKGEKCYGPSIGAFMKCIREGHLFGILTARGHEQATLREGIKELVARVCPYTDVEQGFRNFYRMYMMDEGYDVTDLLDALDDHNREHYGQGRHATGLRPAAVEYDLVCYMMDVYLSKCVFVGVSSQSFMEAHRMDHMKANLTGKQVAIHDMIDHFISITPDELRRSSPISIGFSDDDLVNQRTVKQKIVDELLYSYPDVKFCLYRTHERGYVKEVLHNPHRT